MIPEQIAERIVRSLWRPRIITARAVWAITTATEWTHPWYPDWHESGCPGLYGRGCATHCNVERRRRTLEMSRSGRFYRRVHIGIWLFGVRWYHFWLHQSVRVSYAFDAVERWLCPSMYAEDQQ